MESILKYMMEFSVVLGVFVIMLALWTINLMKNKSKSSGVITSLYAGIIIVIISGVIGVAIYTIY